MVFNVHVEYPVFEVNFNLLDDIVNIDQIWNHRSENVNL